MLAPFAREPLLAALQCRRQQHGLPDSAFELRDTPDREEALRSLMVHHVPRAASQQNDAHLRPLIERVLSLGAAAATNDLRFLDAFHSTFEWLADGADGLSDAPDFTGTYGYLLKLHEENLVSAEFGARSSEGGEFVPFLPPTAGDGQARPAGRRLRVIVLADGLPQGIRLARAIEGLSGYKVHMLVCNNGGAPTWRYAARLMLDVAQSGGAITDVLRLLVRRRLHLRRRELHHEDVVAWLQRAQFWVGLHGMGVIYRAPVLQSFEMGLLNAHIGLLPGYRGRSVMEWSILEGAPTGVTVFFMDTGIDTGRNIILRCPVPLHGCTSIDAGKHYLFMTSGKMYQLALKQLSRPELAPLVNDVNKGRRYYVMSALSRAVVETVLRAEQASGRRENVAAIPQNGSA